MLKALSWVLDLMTLAKLFRAWQERKEREQRIKDDAKSIDSAFDNNDAALLTATFMRDKDNKL